MNKYLQFDKNYLYGDLLLVSKTKFEEPVLVLLEMMRTCFPAGNFMPVPSSHKKWEIKSDNQQKNLLVRVFSLFPLEDDYEIESSTVNDFEHAVFASYAQQLRQQLRFVFQSIMYRLF